MLFCRSIVCLSFAIATISAAERTNPTAEPLTAHEWGTFTSVAGADGSPIQWLPLSGPSDLPCFVHRVGGRNIKVSYGTVRMETPVIYFYAALSRTISVHVDFPHGHITEWYPEASRVGNPTNQIEWSSVEIFPAEQAKFPTEKAQSHYYAARETDSAPIRAGGQDEKLIFYRGMGDIAIPLRPKFTVDGKLEIRAVAADPIPIMVVFDNRGGRAGYIIVRNFKDSLTLQLPELTGDIARLRRDLSESLVSAGLYPKEAKAMIETWADSWFEEGTRVFYIAPRAAVDSELPLTIVPLPQTTQRVFVGRIEMLSPSMENDIITALSAGDVQSLTKHGRFLEPFLSQITRRDGKQPAQSPAAKAFINSAYQALQKEYDSGTCAK
jgi:hypothetical protein